MCNNFVNFFPSIFSPRRASTPFDTHNWKLNCRDNYILLTNAKNFSFLSPIDMEKKSGQRTWPSKQFLKTESDVTKKQKYTFQIFIVIYQSWKFHRNRLNSLKKKTRCTKSVRKKIMISINRNLTLQASLEAFGPIFWNQSIELNTLNKFYSICL